MRIPRRPLWLLVAVALGVIAATFWFIPKTGHLQRSLWHSGSHTAQLPYHDDIPPEPQILEGDILPDRQMLKGAGSMDLSSKFEFRRLCINAHPKRGLERSSLVERPESFFAVPASQVLAFDDVTPPCQGTIEMFVPYFDPTETVDTSELFLGMATTLERINASLPAISRWLPNTGSPLLVLLVDQPDLVTELDKIEAMRTKAANLGFEIIFDNYKGQATDSEGLKNFALAEAFHRHKRERIRWFGAIDDDTFFISLPRMVHALKPFNPEKPFYIGALSESFYRVSWLGFMAWGGAGFFMSAPLMQLLAENSEYCQSLDQGFGDQLFRDCILEVTSPAVRLTELNGLNQIDVDGDISGWYESGWNPLLTLHHWKSWHSHPIPMAHTVSDVAGPDAFLQRYLFADDIVMTNGYSIVSYPSGLPDLNITELTFRDQLNDGGFSKQKLFHQSLGRTRPPLQQGKDKISWIFTYATTGSDGSVRQFYVQRAVEGLRDSVIEVDWRRSEGW